MFVGTIWDMWWQKVLKGALDNILHPFPFSPSPLPPSRLAWQESWHVCSVYACVLWYNLSAHMQLALWLHQSLGIIAVIQDIQKYHIGKYWLSLCSPICLLSCSSFFIPFPLSFPSLCTHVISPVITQVLRVIAMNQNVLKYHMGHLMAKHT